MIMSSILVLLDGPITVSCPAHNPHGGFWQTGPDLFVDPGLAGYILPVAHVLPTMEVQIEMLEFKKVSNQRKIQEYNEYIPKRLFFKASEFLSMISAMIISKQKSYTGVGNKLINNGWANIFNVEGVGGCAFTVLVTWEPECGRWRVEVWHLVNACAAGDRVFYPATVNMLP